MPVEAKCGLFEQIGLFSAKLGNLAEVGSGLTSRRLQRVNHFVYIGPYVQPALRSAKVQMLAPKAEFHPSNLSPFTR